MDHIAIQCALEWYHASGEREPYRLDALVRHFCEVNGITDETPINAMQADAARRLAA